MPILPIPKCGLPLLCAYNYQRYTCKVVWLIPGLSGYHISIVVIFKFIIKIVYNALCNIWNKMSIQIWKSPLHNLFGFSGFLTESRESHDRRLAADKWQGF